MRASRPLSFLTESLWTRAQRLAAEGQHAAAAVEFQVLVDIDPGDLEAGRWLARQLLEAGRHERAAEEYLRQAGVYARLGDERRALDVALEALRLEPSRVTGPRLAPLVACLGRAAAELCEQVSRVHALAGRPDDARDVLRGLVKADPTQLSRRLRLAELDLAAGRLPEALAELRLVADGLRAHGRTEELVRVLEMMHVHGGPEAEVLRELAAIYVHWGQPRRALGKLEALHRIAPTDRVALERLARVHACLGRLELCVRLLDRLVQLIDEQADRGELRAMLRRAASWSSALGYQRALEDLGLRALRPGGVQGVAPRATPRPGLRVSARRRGGSPPPLPRWIGGDARPHATAGEIHVLDDLDELDPEVLPDELVEPLAEPATAADVAK